MEASWCEVEAEQTEWEQFLSIQLSITVEGNLTASDYRSADINRAQKRETSKNRER